MLPAGRALVGFVSIGAMVLSAVGIAYMGISFPDAVSSVDEQALENRRGAENLARSLRRRLESAVDATANALDSEGTDPVTIDTLEATEPLATRPFVATLSGVLTWPRREPMRGETSQDSSPELPEVGFDRRRRALESARTAELGTCSAESERCVAEPTDLAGARATYQSLVRYADTAPAALLGLARIARASGRPEVAITHYRELADRFRSRLDRGGLSYGLIADLGVAELSTSPVPALDLLSRLAGRQYSDPSAALEVAARRARSAVDEHELTPAQARELETLDLMLARARNDAQLARALARELDAVVRTSATGLRGRAALWPAGRVIVHRRLGDDRIVGLILSRAELGALAVELADASGLREGLEPVLFRVDAPEELSARGRLLASVNLGQPVPHLGLALVSGPAAPNPTAELERAKERHLLITAALIALFVLGVIATVRGAARARELARLKSDFVSTVSHELKTPLTSIRMFAEMLQQGVAGEDREREARYQNIIVKESERLGLLIANLLDYSQIERGTRRYTQRNEPAREIAEEAVETFQRLKEGDRCPVHVEVADRANRAEIFVDREVVVQSLLNLLSNAAKYGDGESVDLSVDLDGDEAVALAVTDRGPGIAPSEQARIFREFYRAPEARRSAIEGTGLGLALVKRHVESQGGRVDLKSTPGEGSRFTLVLPRAS